MCAKLVHGLACGALVLVSVPPSAVTQNQPLWVAGTVPAASQFRVTPPPVLPAAGMAFATANPTPSPRRFRHAVLGGAIGAATGVVVCTLISNLLVNTEVEGITTCTTKGYLMLGGGGFVLGATIGALSEPAGGAASRLSLSRALIVKYTHTFGL